MSNWSPVSTTGYPQTEDSLLDVQKRALYKRSYNVVAALSSASRTTTTSTGVVSNPGYKGIMVTLIVSAYTLGGLKIRVTTGTTNANTVYIDSSSLAATGTRTVVVYPGISASASQLGSPGVIGPNFVVSIEHDTADSITYSMSYCLIE